jgi:hypothetical protein
VRDRAPGVHHVTGSALRGDRVGTIKLATTGLFRNGAGTASAVRTTLWGISMAAHDSDAGAHATRGAMHDAVDRQHDRFGGIK